MQGPGQGLGFTRGAAVAQKCATDGCNRLAWNDDFCPKCEEEIRALELMAEADAMRTARAMNADQLHRILREQERRERFRRAGQMFMKWLWVPELVLVAGTLFYLGLKCGPAILDWLGVVSNG